jgi:hypothetical protein
MDRVIEEGAARYRAAQEEGQRIIRIRWAALQAVTKAALTESGLYSDRGERLDIGRRQLPCPPAKLIVANHDIEFATGHRPQDDCERLEYALGVLKQCTTARLPLRTEKGAPIPREAADDEVLSSCEELLFVPAWHDPEFLRMGLGAVVVHQQANALSMIGPPTATSAPLGFLGAVLKVGLLLLLPVALAGGIAAAVKQDVGASALAFYVVGAGVLAAMSVAGVGVKKESGFEQAHTAWMSFQLNRTVGVAGVGALEHLKRMVANGVKVPAVAFDLAEMLRCRMGSQEISGP